MKLDQRDGIFVLELADEENRLDPALLEGFERALDRVEAHTQPTAFVSVALGRFYSNGYDLEWLAEQSRDVRRAFIQRHQALLARILVAPFVTVAAQSGHAVGGGALVALAHDVRIMSRSHGTFWLPEVDAQIPFRPGMLALLRLRLPGPALRDAVLGGVRMDGAAALAAGVVDEAVAGDAVLPRALIRARDFAEKDPGTLGALKQGLYGQFADVLRDGR